MQIMEVCAPNLYDELRTGWLISWRKYFFEMLFNSLSIDAKEGKKAHNLRWLCKLCVLFLCNKRKTVERKSILKKYFRQLRQPTFYSLYRFRAKILCIQRTWSTPLRHKTVNYFHLWSTSCKRLANTQVIARKNQAELLVPTDIYGIFSAASRNISQEVRFLLEWWDVLMLRSTFFPSFSWKGLLKTTPFEAFFFLSFFSFSLLKDKQQYCLFNIHFNFTALSKLLLSSYLFDVYFSYEILFRVMKMIAMMGTKL